MKIKNSLILICIGLIFVACSGKKSQNNTKSHAKESTSKSLSLYDQDGFIEKYNGYIQFQNSGNTDVRRAYNSYYRKYDNEKPLNLSNHPDPTTISGYTENLKKLPNQSPNFGELDKAALQLYQVLFSLDSVLKLGEFYYDKKNYEEDDFKRGKDLNKLTQNLFEKYFDQHTLFDGSIYQIEQELTQRELANFKAEGLMIRYHLLASVERAGDLIGYVNQNSNNNFKEVELITVDSLLVKLDEHTTELEKMTFDNEQVEQELGRFKKSYYTMYVKSLSLLVAESKNFKARLKNKDWKTSITHPTIPDKGTLEKINAVYSKLVENYNECI